MTRPLLAAALLLGACTPPPPAPEGLDDASSFVVREFWSDDATFQAGVQGFMNWFEAEGKALVGVQAEADTTDSFTVGDLSPDDVAGLPLSPQILVDSRNETFEDRNIADAKGVVSLAEMDCDIFLSEDFLVRPDQDVVFFRDWQGYQRDYATPKATYLDALDEGSFTPITTALDPFAADFDASAYADTLLFTDNMVDPAPLIGGLADIEEYPMDLHFRHGIYDIDGVPTRAFAIITFTREAAWGEAGANGLLQSYSIEINVERPGDKTLRMLAVWAMPRGGGLDPEGPIALNYAVNKSLLASETLSDICSGAIDID